MKGKKYSAEQIVAKLREAEVLLAKGLALGEVCRQLEITDVTYYRWRKEYGGLRVDQGKRLKEIEAENARLRKVIADLTIDNSILKEAARGNFEARPRNAGRSYRSRKLLDTLNDVCAGSWINHGQHNVMSLWSMSKKIDFGAGSRFWRPGMAAMATGPSRRCSRGKAGVLTTNMWSASGEKKGSKYHRNSQNDGDCG